jgi:hypothetical protein
MKISVDNIGNPIRKLPAFGAVPQPTALRRDQLYKREIIFLPIVQPIYTLSRSQGLQLASV